MCCILRSPGGRISPVRALALAPHGGSPYNPGERMSPLSSRILVVDDNDALRENLAEALELEGYKVVVAADGDAALMHLEAEPPPGVVLLDLMLPGMSGRDLLALIRTNPRLHEVRVVITTGLSGARARVALADAVLMKPFGVSQLISVLKKVGASPAGPPPQPAP